jgi:hypothetical protein
VLLSPGAVLPELPEVLLSPGAARPELPEVLRRPGEALPDPGGGAGADVTEGARLRAALDLTFDVVEQLASVSPGEYGTTVLKPNSVVEPPADAAQWIDLSRGLLVAMVERDIGRMAVPAVRLLRTRIDPEKVDVQRLVTVARLAGAFGSYLSTSTTGRTPTKEEMEERRKAKKEAFKSLIESQGERRMRKGDPIFSLGSSVGLFVGGQGKRSVRVLDPNGSWIDVQGGSQPRLQPSLTLGVGFDYHGMNCRGFGFHAEIMPLNLGSYATILPEQSGSALAPPSPGDALSPSAMIGVTYLEESANLVGVLGLTAGYSTKLGDMVKTTGKSPDPGDYQGFYLGGVLGVYLPILDLN